MANVKITDLTAYTNPNATDVLPIVDVGADVTKQISIENLLKNASSGTAAAPGIAFDGDSNTGIYRPDADQLAITTNGVERLNVDGDGKTSVFRSGTEGDEVFSAGTSVTSAVRVFIVTQLGNSTAAAALWVRENSTTSRSINAAGTINASGADYAEYMSKSGDFIIAKGDVCGVNSSGNLTKTFAEAVGFVVKSTNPSYVGGDTWGAEFDGDPDGLEVARQKVDRIAFAGQVPVNVLGATPGQYIVPVEASDGGIEGIAKNESDLTLAEYMRAVGKVIANEDDGRARIIVKVA